MRDQMQQVKSPIFHRNDAENPVKRREINLLHRTQSKNPICQTQLASQDTFYGMFLSLEEL